jgi:hypothetical protein
MPIYQFQHPSNQDVIEIFQSMNELHVYTDDRGVEWNRLWLKPNASTDVSVDEFSEQDFVRKTAKEGMTVGDMWDLSKELSQKREKTLGKDPVKDKVVKKYEKDCKKKHPNRNE